MSRFIMPRQGVKGQNLNPSDGALLYFKVVGEGIGGTDKTTYTDAAKTIASSNPVVADATGLFAYIEIDGSYDVFLTDKNGVQLWGPETIDELGLAAISDKLSPLTTAAMANDTRFSTADVGLSTPTTKEFATGLGVSGSGTYDIALTVDVTPNARDIIVGVAEPDISFVLRIDPAYNLADQYGAVGDDDGLGTGTDDSAAIQRAIVAAGVGGYTVLTGSKNYRIDIGLYIPARSTLDGNFARIAYTGTGTGMGQTTSWAGGVATGPVAGITLGEETGALQPSCRLLNFKLNVKGIGATGVCVYGATASYVTGIIEGLFQPFDNTRSNVGVLVRGSAIASNFGNTFDILCNHLHECYRIENYGVANTQPTGNVWLNGSTNGDATTDDSSIGINFANSIVLGQGQGSKILGTNIENCITGVSVGALNDSIYMNCRFEISSSLVGSRIVKINATAENVDINGSGIDAAIGNADGGVDGFGNSDTHRMTDKDGSTREAGNASSFSGFSPPIRATNITEHFFKEDASTNWRTRDDGAGTGRFQFQPGEGSAGFGAYIRLHGHAHASRPGICEIGGSNGKSFDVVNGSGGAVQCRVMGTAVAGTTSLWILDVDNATLEQVTVGAADSGGTGFKVLRIPN